MTNEQTLKYIGYARRSSEDNKERQAASIPDQLHCLEQMKVRDNLTFLETLHEGKTAHVPGREIFGDMMEKIADGKANAIATWHANRLTRNPVDAGYIIFLMDQGKLLEVRTPERAYHNNPDDKFMLQLDFAISKKDSDDKSIVVSRGLEKKCRDGWRPGWAPIGYLNDKGTESGFRRIYADPDRLPFVQKIFELFLAGTSVKKIHQLARDEWHLTTKQHKRIGGRPLSESEIYRILNNAFYCGRFEYPERSGIWHENNPSLERAVTEETFNEVQVKLGNISQTTTRHNYAYTHVLRCGICNSGVVIDGKWQVICSRCRKKFQLTRKNTDHCPKCGLLLEQMPQSKIIHYVYHRCHRHKNTPCRELSISEKQLEGQIDKRLAEIELNPKFLDWAIEQVHQMHEQEKDFHEDTIEATKKAYDGTRRRLDNLVALKISPTNSDGSLLSDEEFKARKIPLEQEIKSIETQLANVDDRMIQANDRTVKIISFAVQAREKFVASTDSKVKRDIFVGLCGLHPTLANKKVSFDAPFYFEKIVGMKKEVPIIGKMVASNNQSLDITKTDEFVSSIPTLLRGQESRLDRQIMSLTCNCTLPRRRILLH